MKFQSRILLIEILLFLGISLNAYANPQGENVVAGTATFDRSTPNTLTVNTTSNNTIINYNSFSIAANETTRFNQPSISSAVLNRVIGADPSAIYGTLSSNGKLFLVNPNGIIFGPNSSVNAPAVVASTLDISNNDFLNGNYNFYQNGGSSFIINQGRLAATPGGYIALLSQAVNNQGIIVAPLGTVALATGEQMTLGLDSQSQISVVVNQAVPIQANGGKVLLTAKVLNDVFDNAVNNSGVIEANSLQGITGTLQVAASGAPVVNTGTIQASNVDLISDGDIYSLGVLESSSLIERGNTFQVGGIFNPGIADVENADHAIEYTANTDVSGIITDPANIIIDPGVTLIMTEDTSFNAGSAFTMDPTAIIAGDGYNLSISALNASTLGNINSVNLLTLSLTSGTTPVTFTSSPSATFQVNTVKTNYGSILSRNVGTGTSADPIMIYSDSNAQGGLQYLNTSRFSYSELANNIDASETSSWNSGAGFVPIFSFSNSFNGKNLTISNLTINIPTNNDVGLFGQTLSSAVLSNIQLSNVNIVGEDFVGGLVGSNAGSISNSSSAGNVIGFGNVSSIPLSSGGVGGLVGYNSGTISSSYNAGNVNDSSKVPGSGFFVGGLVGENGGGGTISNSYNTGNINAPDSGYVGGLVGGQNSGTISNSYNAGSVVGGGFIGGLVGFNNSTISNSFSTESGNAGILVGENFGTVSNSYYDSASVFYSLTNPVYASGTSGAWDFTTPLWVFPSGGGLPILAFEIPPSLSTYVWIGTTSSNWLIPSNWQSDTVPIAGANITIDPGLYNPVLPANISSSDLLIESGAEFDPSTFTITGTNLDVFGTLLVRAPTFAGNYIFSGSTKLETGSTINYSGVSQTIASVLNYSNLITSGSGTASLAGPTIISANLTNNSILDLKGQPLTVSGSFINNDTLKLVGNETPSLGTFTDHGITEYYGSDSYNFIPLGAYNNLQFNNGTFILEGALTSASLTNNSIFDLNGQSLAVNGAFINNGTFKLQHDESISAGSYSDTGTVDYYGSGSYTGLNPFFDNAYNNLQLDNGTFTLNNTLTVNGTLTNNGTFDLAGNQLNVAGTFTNNGTFKLIGSESPLIGIFNDNATTDYYGSGSYTITPLGVYGNLQFDNGTFTLGGTSVFVAAGNITIGPNVTLNMITDSSLFSGNALIMDPTATINGAGFDLSLSAGSASTLGNINNVDLLSFYSGSNFNVTFTSNPNSTFQATIVQTNYLSILSRSVGTGTAVDPIMIYSDSNAPGGLEYIQTNGNLGAYYELANSIDASETSQWNNGAGFVPIGNVSNPFTGNFNGNFFINGLTINTSSDYAGLFGYTSSSAVLSDMLLFSENITGGNYVGGLVGLNNGSVSISYTGGSVSGISNVGGLVGFNNGIISNTYSETNISSSFNKAGGLVGDNEGTIIDSYSTGEVSGGDFVGGLVGNNGIGTIINSFTVGSMSGSGTNIGGLTGNNSGAIINSYFTDNAYGSQGGGIYEPGGEAAFYSLDHPVYAQAPGSLDSWSFAAVEPAIGGEGIIIKAIWTVITGKEELVKLIIEQAAEYIVEKVPLVTSTWVGGIDNVWKNSENWIGPVPPEGDEIYDFNIVIGPSINVPVIPYPITNIAKLTISNNAELNPGNFMISGEELDVSGTLLVMADNFASNYVFGNVKLEPGSTVNYSGTGQTIAPSVNGKGYSNLILSGSGPNDKYLGEDYINVGNYISIAPNITLNILYDTQIIVGKAFSMDPSATIDGGGNDLTISAGSDSTLGNINDVKSLTLNSNSSTNVTFTLYPNSLTAKNNITFNANVTLDLTADTGLTAGNVLTMDSTATIEGEGYDLYIKASNNSTLGNIDDVNHFVLDPGNGSNVTFTSYTSPDDSENDSDFQVNTLQTKFGSVFERNEGSGTASDPIMIYSDSDAPGGLEYIGDTTNNPAGLGFYYEQANNIDASETSQWNSGAGFVPIGSYIITNSTNTPFTGVFNGNYFTISNLTINSPSNNFGALFGYTSSAAALSNIQLTNENVSGGGNAAGVGGLVGFNFGSVSTSSSSGNVSGYSTIGGLVAINFGSISNSNNTGNVSGTIYVGGLVGENNGYISNSYNTGTVNGIGTGGVEYSQSLGNNILLVGPTGTGGLVGWNFYGPITNSFSTGSVSGANWVGGLVGFMGVQFTSSIAPSGSPSITNSYSTGNVSGSGESIGGLVGEIGGDGGGSVINSYSIGTVKGGVDVGGLVGVNGFNGGLITNSYTTGNVSGSNDIGGLVGSIALGNVGGQEEIIFTTTVVITVSTTNGVATTSTTTTITPTTPTTPLPTTTTMTYTTTNDATSPPTVTTYNVTTITTNSTPPAPAVGDSYYTDNTYGTNEDGTVVQYAGFGRYAPGGVGLPVLQTVLAVSGISENNKTYDGTTATASLNTTNAMLIGNSGNITLDTSDVTGTYNSADVATAFTVTLSGLALSGSNSDNYTLLPLTISGRITPAPLTITANNQTLTYGDLSLGTTDFTPSGLMNGETVGSVTLSTNATTDFLGNYNVGTWNIFSSKATGGTFNPNNYSIDYLSGILNVNPADLTSLMASGITINSKTYNGTTTASLNTSNAVLIGVLPEDIGNVTLDTANAIGAFNSKDVGTANAVTVTGLTLSGPSAANYELLPLTISASISPAPLTISAVADSKQYDGTTTSTGTPSTNGLYESDTVTATQSFQSKNVLGAGGSTISVSPDYTVNDGNNGNNYTITLQTANGTITPAPLTISAVTDSKQYDGTPGSTGIPSANGLYGSDTVTAMQSFQSKNVLGTDGSTISVNPGYTVNDGNDGNNYTVSLQTATGTITPAPLTISAVADSKQYDGTTTSTGTPSTNGLYESDTVTATQSFQSKNVLGAGGSTISVSPDYTVNDGNNGNNYTITLQTASGTITPASLTISAVADSKQYDGTATSTGTPSTNGLYESDAVTATESFDTKNVMGLEGSTISVNPDYIVNDGNNGNNYTVTLQTANGTITPAPLTISAVPDFKQYDGTTNSTGVPTVSGLQVGDIVTGLIQVFNSKNVLGAGGSTISVSPGYIINDSNNGNNYSVTLQTASGAITSAPLSISAISEIKQYDGTTLAPGTPSVNGTLYGGDTVTGLSQAFESKNVLGAGLSTIKVAHYTVNDGNNGKNYSVDTILVSGTITPAPLTITATGPTKTYGTALTAGPSTSNFLSQGTVNGELVTSVILTPNAAGLSTTTPAGSTYTVTPSAATGTGGFLASNYKINYASYNGTVAKAPLTISATGPTKTFGAALAAGTSTTNFTASATAVSGQTVTRVTLTPNAAGLSAATPAGSSYTVTPSAATGTGGFSTSNYNITYVPYNGVVTKAPLTITADNQTKVYGDSNLGTSAFTSSGLKNGETIGSVTLTANATTSTSDNFNAGTWAITPSAATGGTFNPNNYLIAYKTGTLTVKPKVLTVTATGINGVYNGTTTATVTLSDNRVAGDVLTDSYTTAAFNNKNVGTNKTITVSGILISGTDAGNYTLSKTTAKTTANITPAPLTITANNQTLTHGNSNLGTSAFTSSGLQNGETIGSVKLSTNATKTAGNYNVGTWVITPSAAKGGTFNAGNYSITYLNGTLTVNPAPLLTPAGIISGIGALSGSTASRSSLLGTIVMPNTLIGII